jgi:uncharacterized membrane protein
MNTGNLSRGERIGWRAEVWGKEVEWDAEITEQDPDKRISWRSVSGSHNAGTVRFEPLEADRTRVRLVMAYEPAAGQIENGKDSEAKAFATETLPKVRMHLAHVEKIAALRHP